MYLLTKSILPPKAASEKVLSAINGSDGKDLLIVGKGQGFWWQLFAAFKFAVIGHWADEAWNTYYGNYNCRKKNFKF